MLFRSVKPKKIKKIKRGSGRNPNRSGEELVGTVGRVWATLVYGILVSEPFGLLSLCCSLEQCMYVCVCVAAYGTHAYIHTGILYSYLGEICIRNHFKCFRLNTQINRKGFPMNAYECVCTVFLLPFFPSIRKPLLMLLFTTSVHG